VVTWDATADGVDDSGVLRGRLRQWWVYEFCSYVG
jgi:hypothetical protein